MKRWLIIVLVFLLGGAVVNVGVAWGWSRWAPSSQDKGEMLSSRTARSLWLLSGGDASRDDEFVAVRILGRGVDRIMVLKQELGGISDLSGHRIVHRSGWPIGSMLWTRNTPSGLIGFQWLPVNAPIVKALNTTVKQAQQSAKDGQHGEAGRLYREAMNISQRLLGTEHPKTLNILDSLAGILEVEGEYVEAEALRREVLDSCRRVFGDAHTVTHVMMSNLGLLLTTQGHSNSAEILFGIVLSNLDKDDKPTMPLRPAWPGFAVNTIFYAAILWLLFPGPFVVRRWVRVWRGLCPRCAYPMGESAVCSECGKALPNRSFSGMPAMTG